MTVDPKKCLLPLTIAELFEEAYKSTYDPDNGQLLKAHILEQLQARQR